jgi:solute carrier family 13 (sodium-dependent dicarboxylate transporter), member 2/3/5
MNTHMIICLVIFVLTIASFLWGKISMGLSALLSMVLLVITGCIDITTALEGFSNSNTIIMACMFIISMGFSKTQMVAKISRKLAKAAKGSLTRVLFGYVIVTCLIAQIVPSAMAVFSIVFPLALGVCNEMEISPSKVMFSIGIVAISTVCTLPIGGGAVYPAQYNGILEKLGAGDYQFQFWDVCVARLPALITVVLYAIFIAPKFAPDKPVIETRDVKPVGAGGGSAPKLTNLQEVVSYLIFFGVVLGLIVTSLQLIKIPVLGEDGTITKTKLDSCVFPLIGALLMVAFGVLKPKEAYVSMGMGGMVLTYVGVLALASGLTNTGTGDLIGNAIASMFGEKANSYVIGLVFFLAPFILTQFMMNWAVLNIFSPIAILTCVAIGANPLGPLVLVGTGSLTAFMTPLATPSVPMFMGIGGYDQKTMFKMGWLPALILCVVNVLWVMTIFPAY